MPLDNYVTNGNDKYVGKFKRFGKTGTTSDNKDRWFSGGTPHYVGCVWFGYDIPKDLGQMQNPSARIWMEVFNQIHKNEGLDPKKAFPKAGRAVQKSYCTRTGNLASDNCSGTATGWYKVNNTPKVCSSCGGREYYDPTVPGQTTRVSWNDLLDRLLGGNETTTARSVEPDPGDGNGGDNDDDD